MHGKLNLFICYLFHQDSSVISQTVTNYVKHVLRYVIDTFCIFLHIQEAFISRKKHNM